MRSTGDGIMKMQNEETGFEVFPFRFCIVTGGRIVRLFWCGVVQFRWKGMEEFHTSECLVV